jgi:hypothetical protein
MSVKKAALWSFAVVALFQEGTFKFSGFRTSHQVRSARETPRFRRGLARRYAPCFLSRAFCAGVKWCAFAAAKLFAHRASRPAMVAFITVSLTPHLTVIRGLERSQEFAFEILSGKLQGRAVPPVSWCKR